MIRFQWIEQGDYQEVLNLQLEIRQKLSLNEGSERIIGVEHTPLVTLGKRSRADDALGLKGVGIPVVQTNRGGLATYHGTGQLTVYPILDLRSRRVGIRDYICGLQRIIISYLGQLGIVARSDAQYPGVWVGSDKIAAIYCMLYITKSQAKKRYKSLPTLQKDICSPRMF